MVERCTHGEARLQTRVEDPVRQTERHKVLMELDPLQSASHVRCTHQGCTNTALLVLTGENVSSVRAWCLGHTYLEPCPACGATAWNCPVSGCGDCQGINEEADAILLEMWNLENRVFGFAE